MTDIDKMLEAAVAVTDGGTPKYDIEALVNAAGQITDLAESHRARLKDSIDWLGQFGEITSVGSNAGLQKIEIKAPQEKAEEVLRAVSHMFGAKNVAATYSEGKKPFETIVISADDEVSKRQLGRLSDLVGKSINQQAEGTIGGLARLGAKTKIKPEGVRTYLEEKFGRPNVWPVGEDPGNFFVKTGGKWRWLDNPGAELLDVVDVLPEVAEAAVGTAGAAAGAAIGSRAGHPTAGAVAGGAIGDVLASVGRQAVSGALPGEDFPGETPLAEAATRAKLVAGNVAGGIAPEVVRGALRMINPSRIVGKRVGAELVAETPEDFLSGGGRRAREIAQERNALAAKHGVELSLGEATGSATIKRLEGLLSDKPLIADTMNMFRVKRVNQLAKATNNVIEAASKGNVGGYAAAKQVANTYKGLLDEMYAERGAVGGELYGRAAELGEGMPIVQTKNVIAIVRDIIGDANVPLKPSGANAAASSLMQQIGNIQPGQRLDIETFQKMRSLWGKAARGESDVFGGSNPKEGIVIAKRIFKALNQDMDETITTPLQNARQGFTNMPAAGAERSNKVMGTLMALKEANETYKLMSERIDSMHNAILEKAVGLSEVEALEKLPGFIVSGAVTPKQLELAVGILSTKDKSAVDKIRGAVLDNIFSAAKEKAPAGGFDISPTALAKGLRHNDEKLRLLFKDNIDGYRAVKEIEQLADIIRDAPFAGGSKTAGMFFFDKALNAFANAGFSPRAFLAESAKLISGKHLARIVNDPTKAAEFLRIVNPTPGPVSEVAQNILRSTMRLSKALERDVELE